MKITALALSFFSISVDAIGFGDIVNKVYKRSKSDAETSAIQKAGIEEDHNPSGTIDGAVEDNGRRLNGCWGDNNPDPKWHPTYSAGWAAGFCQLTVDCNSPGYSSQLALVVVVVVVFTIHRSCTGRIIPARDTCCFTC